MTGKTVTRADLVEALAKRANMQRADANRLLTRMLEMMQDSLVDGETVKLSRFGNFNVRAKRQRIGRNPKTGEEVPITPRRVVTFRPSQMLREFVEKGGRGRAKT
ncbi:MAG: integration host factor subunit alpha [Caulobacteraceae bacterium]|nr:integration host factor subunit alpha [Caulobacteraceae bacterium]MBL8545342.1 integration host factor subunit alpha [Hyphomonadaceae bacterium]MBK8544622.1 integration host factor subunit alpha [Caulobacteraceae bacterium]MBP6689541.1 integration host factor subunit alpha [Hyphomonadaceae bacterium]MBX3429072.1 integration host factor subunit alpha [Hyphomonadaceae bacterium]